MEYSKFRAQHEEQLKRRWHKVQRHFDTLAKRLRHYDADLVLYHNDMLTGGDLMSAFGTVKEAKAKFDNRPKTGRERLAMDLREDLDPTSRAFIETVQTADQVIGYGEKALEFLANPRVIKILGPKILGPTMKVLGNIAKLAGPLGYVAMAASLVPDLIDIFKGKKNPEELVFNLLPGSSEIAHLFGYKTKSELEEEELARIDARDNERVELATQVWSKACTQLASTVDEIYGDIFTWTKTHDEDIPEARLVLNEAKKKLIEYLSNIYDILEGGFNPMWVKTRLNPDPDTPPWHDFTSLRLIAMLDLKPVGASGSSQPMPEYVHYWDEPVRQGKFLTDFVEMCLLGYKFDMQDNRVPRDNDFNRPRYMNGFGFDSSLQPTLKNVILKQVRIPYDPNGDSLTKDSDGNDRYHPYGKPSPPIYTERLLGNELIATAVDQLDDATNPDLPTAKLDEYGYPVSEAVITVQKQVIDKTVITDVSKGGNITDGQTWLERVWDRNLLAKIADVLANDWNSGRDLNGVPMLLLKLNPKLIEAMTLSTDRGDDEARVTLESLQPTFPPDDVPLKTPEEVAAELANFPPLTPEQLQEQAESKILHEIEIGDINTFDQLEAYQGDDREKEAAKSDRVQEALLNRMREESTWESTGATEDRIAAAKALLQDPRAQQLTTKAVESAEKIKAQDDATKAQAAAAAEQEQKMKADAEQQKANDAYYAQNPDVRKQADDDAANAAEIADYTAKLQEAQQAKDALVNQGEWAPLVQSLDILPTRPFSKDGLQYKNAQQILEYYNDFYLVGRSPPAPPGLYGSMFGGKRASRKRLRIWARVGDGVEYPAHKFLTEVDHYVNDPAGWCARGYDFTLTEKNPDVLFLLTPDRPALQGLSMAHPSKKLVEVNATNYIDGVQKTGLPLHEYRQYVISHELGHMLGHEHSNPHPHGQPVPVMHQQTRLGIAGFTPNSKVVPTVKRPREEMGGGACHWVSDWY